MFKYFINLVEPKTKAASVFPFFYVLVLYLYMFEGFQFNWIVTILFFISMVCLDMATTVLNNIVGINNEQNISVYDRNLQLQMEKLNLSSQFNLRVFYGLMAIGIGCGIIVVALTNIFVALIGAICIVVSITYSSGPVPLKNTCLGELASGITMGYLIPLAFLCAQNPSLFIIDATHDMLILNVSMITKWGISLMVPTLVIANLMLANNICDMAKDKADGRLTLSLIIGQSFSLGLWGLMYMLAIFCIILMIIMGIVPKFTIFGLAIIPFVILNISYFVFNPQKAITYKYAVYNLQLIILAVIIPTIANLIYYR